MSHINDSLGVLFDELEPRNCVFNQDVGHISDPGKGVSVINHHLVEPVFEHGQNRMPTHHVLGVGTN